MNYEQAVRMVTDDQNEGVNPERGETLLTEQEAVEHVRNILSVETLTDYGDDLTEAYRIVLTSTNNETRK